jgi:hypothetical protein
MTGGNPMLTKHERTQLEHDYGHQPVSAAGMLLTCAAGLLMVVVLVLVGMDIHTYGQERLPAQAAAQSR